MQALTIGEDRARVVPDGMRMGTEYVRVQDVVLECKDRMSIGDVELAMKRRMAAAAAGDSPWPRPVGFWRDGRFHIEDGRHEYVAALMLGCSHILVARGEPL